MLFVNDTKDLDFVPGNKSGDTIRRDLLSTLIGKTDDISSLCLRLASLLTNEPSSPAGNSVKFRRNASIPYPRG